MKKILLTLAAVGLLSIQNFGQSDFDALRYSQTPNLGSTARSLGLGGAVGVVGADPSSVHSNPAGLAQYKSSSFNISLGTHSLKNQSSYLDGKNNTSNLFIPEFSGVNVIWTNRKMSKGNPSKTGWVNSNFQLGYNKTADFNRTISYEGTNTQNSFTDYVADYVQGLDVSALDANQEQLDEGFYYYDNMFWYSYLIDSASNGNYFGNYDPMQNSMMQEGLIRTRGSMGEFNVAYAANYEHRVYFGASVNVHNVNYSEKNTFSEADDPLSFGNWSSFDFERTLSTTGYGFSGKLGLIFRPNNNIRIGGTIHTPTKLTLTDEYQDELYVVQDDATTDDLRTIEKSFSYTITTPTRYGIQGAYIFGKNGLITAEVETIDYSTMNISSDEESFNATNNDIADNYSKTMNLKLGGEYAMNSFRLRGGFASIGAPMADGNTFNRYIISGGVGMQEKNWSFNVGMSRDLTNDEYAPYTISGIESNNVKSKLEDTRLMVTLSTKF